jgi:predicted membrane-bound dolichyl-phosphate-mannose-protein mannosyltransferase
MKRTVSKSDSVNKNFASYILLLFLLILGIACFISVHFIPKPILINDVGAPFASGFTRLGPPYIAYDFSPPVISGLFFFLASWWANDPVVYQLSISLVLGILWIFLITLTVKKGKFVRWTFCWFLAPSLLLFGLRSWDSIPAVLTAISTVLLSAGIIKWSALTLAIACSSSFYPLLLLPIYLLKTEKKERLVFISVFLISFILISFPFEVINQERWLNSYIVNFMDVMGKGSIQSLLSFTPQIHLVYTLFTAFLFIVGYFLILYKRNEKSACQLILTVLALFLLVGGIYVPNTNLWLLPIAGLLQPSPILFFSFDLVSILFYLFQPVFGIQFLAIFIARTILLAVLLVNFWTLRAPQTLSLNQYLLALTTKLGKKWERFKGILTKTPTSIILVLLGTLTSLILLYRLDMPNRIYFDEEYYVKAAGSILEGKGDPNWIHPPLGKLLMACGMTVFGKSNPLGWRLPGFLLAILCVPTLNLIGTELYGSRKTGLIASLLLCFDFLFFAQARIAMLDIYVLAFSLFGILFYLLFYRSQRLSYIALSGIFFGMAMSSKIIGILPLLLCFVHGIFRCKRKRRRSIILTTLIIISYAVYVLSYVPCFFILGNDLISFLDRQYQMLHSSMYLPGVHPHMSEPWTWPLMVRPLLSFYQTLNINGVTYVEMISHMGNPLVWYIGLVSIVISIWNAVTKKEEKTIFICAWFFLTWLFYFPIGIAHILFGGGRAQYIYYFLQSVPALCLALANALKECDETMRFPLSALALAAALLVFGLCYPVISGLPVPFDYAWGVKLSRLGV